MVHSTTIDDDAKTILISNCSSYRSDTRRNNPNYSKESWSCTNKEQHTEEDLTGKLGPAEQAQILTGYITKTTPTYSNREIPCKNFPPPLVGTHATPATTATTISMHASLHKFHAFATSFSLTADYAVSNTASLLLLLYLMHQ